MRMDRYDSARDNERGHKIQGSTSIASVEYGMADHRFKKRAIDLVRRTASWRSALLWSVLLLMGIGVWGVEGKVATQGSAPPTRADVLRYRGHLGNLRDTAGRVIWTPALPGASAEIRREWLTTIAAAGGTHVPIGPFDGGPAYPGVHWDNPDWTRDPGALRGLVREILATPTRVGHGLVPVIFLDGGSERPAPRLAIAMTTVSRALEGIGPQTVTLPCGWEPQAWTPRECQAAARAWEPLSQGSVLAWHGWPGATSGASRPPVADDPWAGEGARFWRETPFEMFLFQSQPVRTMSQATCGRSVAIVEADNTPGLAYPDDCWMNRLEDAVARVGAGVCNDGLGRVAACGWPRRTVVVFETSTYWDFRGQTEAGVVRTVATRALDMCRRYGVECGFGNGLPVDSASRAAQ